MLLCCYVAMFLGISALLFERIFLLEDYSLDDLFAEVCI